MIKLQQKTRHPLWRTPKHHMDTEAHDHVHWIELFYDLVHVVAVFVLGNYVSHHLDFYGVLIFIGLFFAMWMAWADISWFNSLYVSTDLYHRFYMTAIIITVILCSAAVESLEKSWVFFAVGYAINRFIIARLYWRAGKVGDSVAEMPREMARNYAIMGVLILLSAFIPKPVGYYFFTAALAWHMVWFVVPKIGVMRFERNRPRVGHMSERFALLMLIVSGEGFFKLVLTLSEKAYGKGGLGEIGFQILVNNIIGAISIFAICWIYYDFAANAKPKNDKVTTLYTWNFAHMFLMLGTVMMGVAMVGEVKVKFFEPFPTGYAFLGCFGLAIYLIALYIIQTVIEERVAHRFSMDWIRWFGVGLAIATYFIVPHVPSIVGNLLWGTALFSQIVVPLYCGVKTMAKENDL